MSLYPWTGAGTGSQATLNLVYHSSDTRRFLGLNRPTETAREASPPINFGVDLLANQKPLLTPQMLPMVMPPARDITRGGAGADTHEEERRHPPVNPS